MNRADAKLIQDDERQQVLAAFHIPDVQPLAVGTEAEVYPLDDKTLLKLYADSSRLPHLETLQKLYASVHSPDLPLPQIHQITRFGNLLAVVETRMEGEPLENRLSGLEGEALQRAETLYLDVVWKLREINITKQPDTYLLFDETGVSDTRIQSFETFYANALEKKVSKVGQFFDDPAFAKKAAALVEVIRGAPPAKLALVHGDFFPGNVLVDQDMTKVTGVIDFGSFTLFGDFLLDIAGAFGFYKMYHPQRKTIRQHMLIDILKRLMPDEKPGFFRFLLAHALLTCDLYAPDPDPRNDGHFQWAAEIVGEDYYWSEAL